MPPRWLQGTSEPVEDFSTTRINFLEWLETSTWFEPVAQLHPSVRVKRVIGRFDTIVIVIIAWAMCCYYKCSSDSSNKGWAPSDDAPLEQVEFDVFLNEFWINQFTYPQLFKNDKQLQILKKSILSHIKDGKVITREFLDGLIKHIQSDMATESQENPVVVEERNNY